MVGDLGVYGPAPLQHSETFIPVSAVLTVNQWQQNMIGIWGGGAETV